MRNTGRIISAIPLSGLFAAANMGLVAPLSAQEPHRGGAPSAALDLNGNRVESTFNLASRLILVDVLVNDQGPFPFALDTAAGLTVVDRKLADKLGLKSIGNAQVGDATTSGPQSAPLYKLEGLRMGTAKWTGGAAVGLDLDELFDSEPDHPLGILGMALFADCLLTVDYATRHIVLEKGELPPPDGKSIVACEYRMGLPLIKTELAGQSIELTLDTGAGLSLALAESLKKSIPLKGDLTPVGISKRVNTEETTREARAAGDLALGGFQVETPRLTFSGVRSVVGFDVLKNFTLTFDRKNARLRLAATGKSITIAPRYVTGFGTQFVDGARKVRWVLPGLPAEKAGLKVGDEVTAIDGKVSKNWKHAELVERYEKPGKLALDLKRGEQAIHIDLEIIAAVP